MPSRNSCKDVGRITRRWANFFWGSQPLRHFSSPAIEADMFALPLYDDNPSTTIPFVTYTLIVACVFAFVWQMSLGPRQAHQIVVEYGMIPAVLFGYGDLPRHLHPVPAWATLFTSMFLHGGWLHLCGNIIYPWVFGGGVGGALRRGPL